MTPKEKAEELVNIFDLPTGLMSSERKECALILSDELIKELCEYDLDDGYTRKRIEYLQKVKTTTFVSGFYCIFHFGF